jgi:glutamate:GABA antiporter
MSSVPETPHLKRTLGLRDTVLFIITAGTGLQWCAAAAAAGPSSLILWVIGGVLFFVPLSVCVVFLSARYPDEGGFYVWGKRAFGPFVGFMTGWTYWTANLPFFPSVMYFSAGSALYWSGQSDAAARASPSYFIAFSIGALILAVALNLRGMTIAKWLNNAGAVARWVGTALLVVLGLASWWRFGPATPITRHSIVPGLRLSDAIFWATIAFAWTGIEATSLMGGEIHDPKRTVPKALVIGAPMIALIYLLGTTSVLLSLPPDHTNALYGVLEAISADATRLGLSALIPIGALCASLAGLGSICLWLGAVARIPFVAGIDRYLPKRFGRLHPKYGTPSVAIWTQAVVTVIFVLLGQAGTSVRGAYNVLVDLTVIVGVLPFIPLFGAAIKLSGEPSAGADRVPGGRTTIVVLGLMGLVTTTVAIVLAFVPPADDKNPALAAFKVAGMTAAILACGAAIYYRGARRRALTPPASAGTPIPVDPKA